MSDEKSEAVFVYLGRRGNSKADQRNCYQQVSGWGSEMPTLVGEVLTFAIKRARSIADSARPGAVLSIPAKSEGGKWTVWFGRASYLGRWSDSAEVLFWDAADQASRVAVSTLSAKTKLASACSFEDALLPIRSAYRGAAPASRAALLAALIRFITA